MGKLHIIKRLSDNKIFYSRYLQKPNKIDFDIVFEIFKNGKWQPLKDISHNKISFHVPEYEKKNIQIPINF